MQNFPLSPTKRRVLGALALIFGVVTVFKGGSVIFGPDSARAAVGNFVPFVVWFNFLAGFFYVAGGAGIWAGAGWARPLAWLITLATLAVGVAFGVHVLQGGAYSMQTVGALPLRLGFWAFVAYTLRQRT